MEGYGKRQESAANGRMMRGAAGHRGNDDDGDEDEADDERESVGMHGGRGRGVGAGGRTDESVSSGISPVETRPVAFRY